MSNLILLRDFLETQIELWRLVEGYSDYEVSNLGRVRSFRIANRPPPKRDRGVVRKPFIMMNPNVNRTDCGYPSVSLFRLGGKRGRTTVVHRLVARAFIPNPENKPFVNHKNGLKSDSRADNLEWSTFEDNREHAVAHGMYPHGDSHGLSILTSSDVRSIRGLSGDGLSIREINKLYPQVAWSTVYAVVKNKIWRHVV